MRLYSTIIFVVAITFEILSYYLSKYKEKLNERFIESKHDFLVVISHHLLALS